tara:strand:- start:21022 stop:22440 length:1419 start_codon:yes stop_codon:yes gene_type:complete
MTLKKMNIYIKESITCYTNYRCKVVKALTILLITVSFTACEGFVEIDLPKDQLATEAVFEDEGTALAALANIYAQMRDAGLTSGAQLATQMGYYTDELDYFNPNSDSPFYEHGVLPSNSIITGWWDGTYKRIYAANAVIEGAENSASLSLEAKNQLMGEGLFIRAYLHSLLVNLYGAIPYVNTTNYITNTTVSRLPVNNVYEQIVEDLILAESLLGDDVTGESVRPYKDVANALLAHMYLYTEQWALAESTATKLINNFVLEPDLSKVFLKNASGSIWQYKPDPDTFANALESMLIITGTTPGNVPALSNALVNSFESADQRKSAWLGSVTDGTDIWYFSYKYKEDFETTSSLEYSVLFRLAEQYLIRSEARAQLGNISGAQNDLNVIRNRAGLGNTPATTLDELQDAILQERRVELFTEKGQRWFDLKRLGKAGEVLGPIKPSWKATDILLPIPESAILLNPNLLPQNDGY